MVRMKVIVIPEVQRLVASQVASGEGVSRQQRETRLQVRCSSEVLLMHYSLFCKVTSAAGDMRSGNDCEHMRIEKPFVLTLFRQTCVVELAACERDS